MRTDRPDRLTLAMIVKDEAETIMTTLDSVRAVLGPALATVVIQDTGSTDDTVRTVQQWALRDDAPGDGGSNLVLIRREWADFATNRNACLDVAFSLGRSVLMLDAGTVLRGEWAGRVPAQVEVRLGTDRFERPQVFDPGSGWHYVGKVHEYAATKDGSVPAALDSSGLIVDYCLKDTARETRWTRDLILLEGDCTPRGRFYYAQTLECLGRRKQAYRAYLERAVMTETQTERNPGGWYQEAVVALIRAAKLALDQDEAEVCVRRALALDGSRGEAWLALCPWAAKRKAWTWLYGLATKALLAAPRDGALFVDTEREWRAHDWAASAMFAQGRYRVAIDHWTRALTFAVPADAREQMVEGIKTAANHNVPDETWRAKRPR